MRYEVILHSRVDKFLSKINEKLKKRIKNKLEKLKDKPYYGKVFFGTKYRILRVGDYRIIYEIADKIKILFIEHRKKIYERFKDLLII